MLNEICIKDLLPPLTGWYENNKRSLPWRESNDPYRIWVSEIMLQQTRVEAVIPFYERFLNALPAISDLAACEEDRLMKLWEGLGYYSRVRNMQKAARVIMERFNGQMPQSYDAILQLPGIGPYTAGAIVSIAFGEARPAVDGNVLRILARVSDDPTDILSSKMKKDVTTALLEAMGEFAQTNSPGSSGAAAQADRIITSPGTVNQAMMDLGACICTPNGAPKCDLCPWNPHCLSRQRGTSDTLPVRIKKTKRRIEERTVLLIVENNRVLLHKRPKDGLLAGLYEFPNLRGHLSVSEAEESVRQLGLEPIDIEILDDAKHIFSHIEWRMKGYLVRVASRSISDANSQSDRKTTPGSDHDAASRSRVSKTAAKTTPGSDHDAASRSRVSKTTAEPTGSPVDSLPLDGSFFMSNKEALRKDYSLPSAFSAYAKLL